MKREPSPFAKKLLEGFRKTANKEVQRHLREGRSVAGVLKGKKVWLHPDGSVVDLDSDGVDGA